MGAESGETIDSEEPPRKARRLLQVDGMSLCTWGSTEDLNAVESPEEQQKAEKTKNLLEKWNRVGDIGVRFVLETLFSSQEIEDLLSSTFRPEDLSHRIDSPAEIINMK